MQQDRCHDDRRPEAADNFDRTQAMAPAGLDTTQMGFRRVPRLPRATFRRTHERAAFSPRRRGRGRRTAGVAGRPATRARDAFRWSCVATVGENADILLSDPASAASMPRSSFAAGHARDRKARTAPSWRRIAVGEEQVSTGAGGAFGNRIFVFDPTREDTSRTPPRRPKSRKRPASRKTPQSRWWVRPVAPSSTSICRTSSQPSRSAIRPGCRTLATPPSHTPSRRKGRQSGEEAAKTSLSRTLCFVRARRHRRSGRRV